MRPLRLDLAGFAVFREPTTIDFTGADFFALVGPTGSGKSTVLDAICFALYGTVPRWVDRRSVANALAPSCPEARVRLIFEAAGQRYAATRVVRRVGRSGSRVEQTHAGLERLPADFDVSQLDAGSVELGEVLAGTPGEMEQAVTEAVGLPYDQFVTCVVLPQGQFAQFLHAKGAQRQQILINLLGLHVYERVRERAVALQRDHEARAATLTRMLADMADADDAAVQAATARLDQVRRVAERVEALLPELRAADAQVAQARQALQRLEAEITQLTEVRAPTTVAQLAATVARAREEADRTAAALAEAEEAEAAARDEVARRPDPATLRQVLRAYQERDRGRAEAARFAEQIADLERELHDAQAASQSADAEVAEAEQRLARAQADHLAAEVRDHLVAGEPCPVCLQPVTALPESPAPPALAEAKAALAAARSQRQDRDRAVRDLERRLAQARAHHDRIAARLTELDAHLAAYDDAEAVTAALQEAEEWAKRLAAAGDAVRAARAADRDARAALQRAETAVRDAWREFDTVRDAVAALAPPAPDRADVHAAWRQLAAWAEEQAARRTTRRSTAEQAVRDAEAAATRVSDRLSRLFADAGLPMPAGDFGRAAAIAVERAEAELRRVTERRDQAAALREQLREHEEQARVAKTLANHLKATNFERWLLEEALDILVDAASEILRQLSGGQYDLIHHKGEFAVVDHHDADLPRPVRTLSGGETFQASLALALALSEQLAGMSATAASLESIVLDEGFGTLDAGTLDTVAATLENLVARGDRMVGVVTHVPALAERIPVRYEVIKDARTARVQRVS